MDPKYKFDPEDPSYLGPKYYFEPSAGLRKFDKQQIQNLEELIENIRRNINTTNDSVLKEELKRVLQKAEINLKKNRLIYFIEYFNEFYNHLKSTIQNLP
jgi:hypothetical protein